jgi:hypothetical protein
MATSVPTWRLADTNGRLYLRGLLGDLTRGFNVGQLGLRLRQELAVLRGREIAGRVLPPRALLGNDGSAGICAENPVGTARVEAERGQRLLNDETVFASKVQRRLNRGGIEPRRHA